MYLRNCVLLCTFLAALKRARPSTDSYTRGASTTANMGGGSNCSSSEDEGPDALTSFSDATQGKVDEPLLPGPKFGADAVDSAAPTLHLPKVSARHAAAAEAAAAPGQTGLAGHLVTCTIRRRFGPEAKRYAIGLGLGLVALVVTVQMTCPCSASDSAAAVKALEDRLNTIVTAYSLANFQHHMRADRFDSSVKAQEKAVQQLQAQGKEHNDRLNELSRAHHLAGARSAQLDVGTQLQALASRLAALEQAIADMSATSASTSPTTPPAMPPAPPSADSYCQSPQYLHRCTNAQDLEKFLATLPDARITKIATSYREASRDLSRNKPARFGLVADAAESVLAQRKSAEESPWKRMLSAGREFVSAAGDGVDKLTKGVKQAAHKMSSKHRARHGG